MSLTNGQIDNSTLDTLVKLFPRFSLMSRGELRAFARQTRARIVEDSPRDLMIRAGAPVQELSCLISGWAARYTVLSDGRRQILAFMIPGSFICVHALCAPQMPFSVQALTPTVRLALDIEAVIHATRDMPRVPQIFYAIGCHDLAEAEDQMTGLGRRDATEKISRLILKLYTKLRAIGLADTLAFDFPLRQNHIADSTGLTTVHVNRILRQLRLSNVATLEKGMIEIHNIEELLMLADMSAADLETFPVLPRGWSDMTEPRAGLKA